MTDWKESLAQAMADGDRERERRRGKLKRFDTYLPLDLLRNVEHCARERGISRAGYIRRALSVQVAKDLGLNWKDVAASSPIPAEWGSRKKADPSLRDDGRGFGDWG